MFVETLNSGLVITDNHPNFIKFLANWGLALIGCSHRFLVAGDYFGQTISHDQFCTLPQMRQILPGS